MIPFRAYAFIAAVALLSVGAGGLYYKGRLDANHKAELATVTAQRDRLKSDLEREQKAREADAVIATENYRRAEAMQQTITELEEYARSRTDVCLTVPDVDRLQNLWK